MSQVLEQTIEKLRIRVRELETQIQQIAPHTSSGGDSDRPLFWPVRYHLSRTQIQNLDA